MVDVGKMSTIKIIFFAVIALKAPNYYGEYYF